MLIELLSLWCRRLLRTSIAEVLLELSSWWGLNFLRKFTLSLDFMKVDFWTEYWLEATFLGWRLIIFLIALTLILKKSRDRLVSRHKSISSDFLLPFRMFYCMFCSTGNRENWSGEEGPNLLLRTSTSDFDSLSSEGRFLFDLRGILF